MISANGRELEYQCMMVQEEIERARLSTLRRNFEVAYSLGFPGNSDKELAAALNRYIEDCDVLDVGSGYNGFFIDSILTNVNTRITAINPEIHAYYFERNQINSVIREYIGRTNYDSGHLKAALLFANSRTFPYYAHDLQFPDNSFDIVLDNCAVFWYASSELPLAFAKSVQEMVRVTRPGGRILASSKGEYGTNPPGWREQILIDMGLHYRPQPIGVEITVY